MFYFAKLDNVSKVKLYKFVKVNKTNDESYFYEYGKALDEKRIPNETSDFEIDVWVPDCLTFN
ncbi:hypothetical protein RFI_32975 [Reticulomyxa filosa]|uniref:Uncharacterized protein n=1 Tax=Reticulomyxa filosa TaxID=46433 RepID=X6LUP6_RETFI|nr:hypothetical protein RFI_32975 [Reticulomyxa filosa]|eukprot:ETO04425.1 hypothetical protein RFI_32975 [Reticulomyxa filosa]